ncbi:MAG TPA: Fic family protein, partial [Microbacterium sp.]|nr:Fic family protein [Microbacterium sp.]
DQVEDSRSQLLETTREVLGTANHDLVALLMERPYARSRDVMARCGVSRPTAAKWLRALVAAGVLRELRVGRDLVFINEPLMAVLTAPRTSRNIDRA